MKIQNKIQLILVLMYTVNHSTMAQEIEVIADYPLIESLSDQTGNYGNVFLQGNPTPPEPPSIGTELCSNDIYIIDANGQNIQTPVLTYFDLSNFQVELDFKITAFPTGSPFRDPIIMGGNLARWLGLYVDPNGILGIKHNNFNYSWSDTSINQVDTWYSARLRYSNETADLYLNDQLILTENVGSLTPFNNDFNFTSIDFSEGNASNACIRNLIISSTPDLVFKATFE
jgi:hypothetical protein